MTVKYKCFLLKLAAVKGFHILNNCQSIIHDASKCVSVRPFVCLFVSSVCENGCSALQFFLFVGGRGSSGECQLSAK